MCIFPCVWVCVWVSVGAWVRVRAHCLERNLQCIPLHSSCLHFTFFSDICSFSFLLATPIFIWLMLIFNVITTLPVNSSTLFLPFLTGCFVLCWTPGLVVLLLDGLGCDECKVLRYEKYCLVLAECNSFVNPIIYSLRDRDMRRTFTEILCLLNPWHKKDNSNSEVHFNTMENEVLSESNGADDSSHKQNNYSH